MHEVSGLTKWVHPCSSAGVGVCVISGQPAAAIYDTACPSNRIGASFPGEFRGLGVGPHLLGGELPHSHITLKEGALDCDHGAWFRMRTQCIV